MTSNSNPLKPAPQILAPFVDTRRVPKHLQLTQEVREVAVATFLKVQQTKEEQISKGLLDSRGNPHGTRYHEDGRPVRKRSLEPLGEDGRRRRKQILKVGDIFGDLTIIKKAPRLKSSRPNLEERWRCKCSCGNEIIVPKYYLVRRPNPKTHCGCKVATIKSLNRREYRIWMMVNQRINNPKHNSYEHYKKRGITLHPQWSKDKVNGFKNFLEHVGPSPGFGYSLDRIDNNKGYIPGNLRWATATEQRANQGDSIAGYTSEQIADMGLTEEEFIEKIISGEIQYDIKR